MSELTDELRVILKSMYGFTGGVVYAETIKEALAEIERLRDERDAVAADKILADAEAKDAEIDRLQGVANALAEDVGRVSRIRQEQAAEIERLKADLQEARDAAYWLFDSDGDPYSKQEAREKWSWLVTSGIEEVSESERLTSLERCLRACDGYVNDHDYICECRPVDVREALREIERLRQLEYAIDRGGWDISPCRLCGLPVVCLPDGLPSCEDCAKEEGA